MAHMSPVRAHLCKLFEFACANGLRPLEPQKAERQKGMREVRICSMAIFHANFSTVQRSKGQNAIASAAYIGGLRLQKLDGEMADYSRKNGVCGHKIIVPSDFEHMKAPSAQWVWATAESTEKRKNSTTARRGDLALPKELNHDECLQVGYAYAQDIADRYGVIAQVNFHDLSTDNPHIDMQFTTRVFDGKQLGVKTRVLDDKKTGPQEIVWMREQWAHRVNAVLAKYGTHIDHRSYKDQGSEKLATQHLGRKATALERNGVKTERGKYNDKVREHNALIDVQALVAQEIHNLEYEIQQKHKEGKNESNKHKQNSDTPALSTTSSHMGRERDAELSKSGRSGNPTVESSRQRQSQHAGHGLCANNDPQGDLPKPYNTSSSDGGNSRENEAFVRPPHGTGGMAETADSGNGKACESNANLTHASSHRSKFTVGRPSTTAQRNPQPHLEHTGAPRADPAAHAEIVKIERPKICLGTQLAPSPNFYTRLKQKVAAIERDCSQLSALVTQNALAEWLYMCALQQLRTGWTYDYSNEEAEIKNIQILIGKLAEMRTIAALAEHAQHLAVFNKPAIETGGHDTHAQASRATLQEAEERNAPAMSQQNQHKKEIFEKMADASIVCLGKNGFHVKAIVEDDEVRLIVPTNEHNMSFIEVNNEKDRTESSRYDTDDTRNGGIHTNSDRFSNTRDDTPNDAPSDEWDYAPR